MQKDKEKAKKAKAAGKAAFIVDEAVDTELEYMLRRRKIAIKKLLSKVGMKPVVRGEAVQRIKKQNGVLDFHREKKSKKSNKDKAQPPGNSTTDAKGKGKAKADEGEEEGSELAKTEVEGVLAKASRAHLDLPEMEPPPHFSLELRSYQKQALRFVISVIRCSFSLETDPMLCRNHHFRWMCDKERGIEDEEDQQHIHPLWAQ